MLGAIGIGVGVLALSPRPSATSLPTSGEPCAATPIALEPGDAVPSSDLASVDLLAPSLVYGVTLTAIGCTMGVPPLGGTGLDTERFPLRLAVSHDGGAHFAVTGAPLPAELDTGFGSTTLVSLDANELFVLDAAHLVESMDAGRHWRLVTLSGPVAALARAGSSVVALTEGDWRLWSTTRASGRFSAAARGAPLPERGASASLVTGPTDASVYLVPFTSSSPGELLQSRDLGSTWQTLADPCRAPYLPTPIALAVAPSGRLDALCGGAGVLGAAPRAEFTSDDDAMRWVLQASGSPSGADASGLPLQDFGDALGVADANELLLASANALYESADSGARWQEARGVNLGGEGGESVFSFLDDGEGLVLVPGIGLYWTNDARRFTSR